MGKVNITKLKKGLSALHVRYADFCLIDKIDMSTAEIIIIWASWIKDDIDAVMSYLNANYNVEMKTNNKMYITQK